MINKTSSRHCLSKFTDWVNQKRWIAVSLLVASVVILGGIGTLGGLRLFASHHTFAHVLNALSHQGALAALGGGGSAFLVGLVISGMLLKNKGRTPLHKALEKQGSIESHLEGNLNRPDHQGSTPLHYAVLFGGVDRLLQEETVQVNAKNHDGLTPLQLAIHNGKLPAVQKLLALDNVEVDMKSVLWVISHGKKEIVDSLLASEKCKGPWRECLLAAVDGGRNDYVQEIAKKYTLPSHQELKDAFVLAAYHHRGKDKAKYEAILEGLLQNGVDVNAQSSKGGSTALHQAANTNNIDLVQWLLKKEKIEVSKFAFDGKTALELAMEWPWIEVAVTIIESGKATAEDLKSAKEKAENTMRGGGKDCSRVIAAINKQTNKV